MMKLNRIKYAVTLLLVALLAACVPVPQPEQPAAAGVNVEVVRELRVLNNASVGGALDVTGDLSMDGAITIGDGGDTVAINSNDWDISTTGVMTGIGAITSNGLLTGSLGATISGATTSINASSNFATNLNTGTSTGALTLGGGSGTVAVNSSDWDISTTGVMTGIGAITSDGLITGTAGATVSGATTSINASSNFGTNINTGTSTGALALGGGSGTVAIDSSDWDISTTGAMTGIGAITADGAVSFTDTLAVTGATTWGAALNKITAGSVVTVTNGAAFAIAATMQPLTAAGAVTPTITIPAAGVVACVYNTSANTINIADSGNQVLTAAAALGQYDMLCGYSDGTRFIETSRADN